MTNVGKLILTSLIKYKINESRSIINTHFLPRENPEVKIILTSRNMSLRVNITTAITKPDIITTTCKNESIGLLRRVLYPIHMGSINTMLKENSRLRWISGLSLLNSTWNSLKAKNVAIFSYDSVFLKSKAIFIAEVLK